jgi:hypothetical protein
MTQSSITLDYISFIGPSGEAKLDLSTGVNVICGSSNTGKSFLVEAIDFMLGSKTLRQIPESQNYAEVILSLAVANSEVILRRSISGGSFNLQYPNQPELNTTLAQKHQHGKTDNLSGFLLDEIGLLNRQILSSKKTGKVISLSFRNLARLVLVDETAIQHIGSPFWGGQFTLKTSEMATIKLLLTGVDDSAVVAAKKGRISKAEQITLLEGLHEEMQDEEAGDREELEAQMARIEDSIGIKQVQMAALQTSVDKYTKIRRDIYSNITRSGDRFDEVEQQLSRFRLLDQHYEADLIRVSAIVESGIIFSSMDLVRCPHCGAAPDAQDMEHDCAGDVGPVVEAANAEKDKITQLKRELQDSVVDLTREQEQLVEDLNLWDDQQEMFEEELAIEIPKNDSEQLRTDYSSLMNERTKVATSLQRFSMLEMVDKRLRQLTNDDDEENNGDDNALVVGIPNSAAHAFSKKVSDILKAWNFPGDCEVHFDKSSSDFIIDGKARTSNGKGLRAITHAAVTLGLMEFCQENGLPHLGFVVLDSPLLAYYEPEGDDDLQIQGSDLKQKFYDYLINKYDDTTQVLIVENQHPPESIEDKINLHVFTSNPNEGRAGLL